MMYIKWKSIIILYKLLLLFLTQIENGSSKREIFEKLGLGPGTQASGWASGSHDYILHLNVVQLADIFFQIFH